MTVAGYAKNVLVDADWAQTHLDDPSVRFVEVDVDTSAYDESHLPGAVGWNWTSQLSDGVRRDVASREDFTALLRQSGIGPESTIVLYGDNNNWFAAWAYWQLKLFGWDNVRILDGGRKLWLARGLPVATDVPSHPSTDLELSEPDFSHRAFRDDVLKHVESSGALVDVRSPGEYSGELLAPAALPQEGAQRAGHAPHGGVRRPLPSLRRRRSASTARRRCEPGGRAGSMSRTQLRLGRSGTEVAGASLSGRHRARIPLVGRVNQLGERGLGTPLRLWRARRDPSQQAHQRRT